MIAILQRCLFAFVLLATFGVGSARALTVDNVRIGAHPDKTRIVFELSEKTDFRVFSLSDPWRIVVDMPDFDWQVQVVPTPAGSGVKGIRQGSLQPGFSRIVIDLSKPGAIKSVFFIPRDNKVPDRLVVDLAGVTGAEFMAQKDKVYGRLKPGGSQPSEAVAEVSRKSPPVSVPALKEKTTENTDTVASAVNSSRAVPPPRKPTQKSYGKPLIIIDAGHGGVDPGAAGPGGLAEKQVTLSMAKELKRQLEASGRYKVLLTRDKDTYLRLYQRVNFARKNEGDLFISLHADSIGKSNVRGASVYTLSENASDEQTEMLAMRENRADLIAGIDLSAEDEVVVNILVDLTMRDTMNQSSFLANTVVNNIGGNGIKTLENAHRSAGFAVLKAPDIPSVLIEMGFMSNGSDAQMLSSSAFQQKLAKSLLTSLDEYFERVRQNERI